MQADSSLGRRIALQILAGEEESQRSNPPSYPACFQMQNESIKEQKIQLVGKRKELLPRNRKQTCYHKIKKTSPNLSLKSKNEKENKTLPTINQLCSLRFHEKFEV